MALARVNLHLDSLSFVYDEGVIVDVQANVAFDVVDDGDSIASLVRRGIRVGAQLTATERQQLRAIVARIKQITGAT